jgi:hypothetical protein
MNVQEHIDWCKQRALEYVEVGDLANAVASMMSDLRKGPVMPDSGLLLGLYQIVLLDVQKGDKDAVRRWITGFGSGTPEPAPKGFTQSPTWTWV